MPKTNTKTKKTKETVNQPAPEKVAKFDRSQTQTVHLGFNYKGRAVEVSHTLNFPTDERITQYYRERIVEDKLSEKGVESVDEISAASVQLWNDLAIGREGYADNNRADWKEKTNALHKENCINGLLSCAGILPEILDAEFIGVEDDEQELIRLKILFDGNWIFTETVLNQPNAEQMRRYRKIRDSNVRQEGETLVETTSFNVSERAALFDELLFESVGYDGEIPIHHKAIAARVLFERQIEFVAKN